MVPCVNAGSDGEQEEETSGVDDSALPTMSISSEMKRNALHRMSVPEFCNLIEKIESFHESLCKDIQDSFQLPEVCSLWIKSGVEDRKLPFQEKHIMQQASILGNLENFGVLKNSLGRKPSECECEKPVEGEEEDGVPAVIEFGAGRGYLTQMLADCYGINRVFLVERKAYKLKADRSLRQNERLMLERLRIDIEDLDLNAVESLQGVPFLAIGKHLCGAATDLTLRCCFPEYRKDSSEQYTSNNNFGGLAIATCCHHLCQWKHYTNKRFFLDLGMTKEEFHAITWFTSWAVDANHGSDLPDTTDCKLHLQSIKEQGDGDANGVEKILSDMEATKRAALGFKCKWIIDIGRLMWLRERGLDAKLVRYVPPSISPENHLLIARPSN
ncbi:S-adenosyl-L-methionine-dependent methyltransferase [Sesbania bispinosa]|nr:S-adenosyl-L-methionine-dependent methyltransferase [Sesbania bispinosa]